MAGLFDATRPGFGYEKQVRGGTNDWLTPPDLVKMLGSFELDPCGCPGMPWRLAPVTFMPPRQDGLSLPWKGRVFCNPPYGDAITDWVERIHEHGDGILLIYSRTETDAWLRVWATGHGFLFPHGRIAFYTPRGIKKSGGTAPSALIAYGRRNVAALRNAGIAGAFLERPTVLEGVRASSIN